MEWLRAIIVAGIGGIGGAIIGNIIAELINKE